jgi:hypothetical protein
MLIMFGGKIVSLDELINPLPFAIKATLIRVGVAWRVLVFSFIIGVLVYHFDHTADVRKLIITYTFANSFYALLLKGLLDSVEKWIRKKIIS